MSWHFSEFHAANPPPVFLFMEAFQELIAAIRAGTVDDPGLNEAWIASLRTHLEMARDRVRPGNPLNADDLAILALYTAECPFHKRLNKILGDPLRTGLAPFKKPVWMIHTAMTKCPPPKKRTVFRAIQRVVMEDQIARFKASAAQPVVRPVTWYGFGSTSYELDQLAQFLVEGDCVLFAIELKSDMAKSIEEYSCHPHEREVLMPTCARFDVAGTLELQLRGNRLLIVQLVETAPIDFVMPMVPRPVEASVEALEAVNQQQQVGLGWFA